MLEVLLLVLGTVAVVVVAVMVTALGRVLLLRRRHRARIEQLEPRHRERAVLFGVASDGRTQVRGVGTLVVSDDVVAFVTLVAGRDLQVLRDDVTSVSLARTFLGRGAASELLVVTWEARGTGDAAAFVVDDPAAWRDRLA